MPDFQVLKSFCIVMRQGTHASFSYHQLRLGSCDRFRIGMERTLSHLIQLFTDEEIKALDKKCAKGLLGSWWQGQYQQPGILALGHCPFPHILCIPNTAWLSNHVRGPTIPLLINQVTLKSQLTSSNLTFPIWNMDVTQSECHQAYQIQLEGTFSGSCPPHTLQSTLVF